MVRLLTGDSCGLVKAVHVEEEVISKWGAQSRRFAVQGLCWSGPSLREEVTFSSLHAYARQGWVVFASSPSTLCSVAY
jgi:hypothetical protein